MNSASVTVGNAVLHHGESVEVLREIMACSVDSVVTDPPSGTNVFLPFQEVGKEREVGFDHLTGKKVRHNFKTSTRVNLRFREAFQREVWPVYAEAYRVLKPGGYGVFWGIHRAIHWTAWGLEEAGFSVLDYLIRKTHRHRLKSPHVEGCLSTQVVRETELWALVRKPGDMVSASKNRARWGTGYLNVGPDKQSHLVEGFPRNVHEVGHPTEKSVDWMRFLVDLTTPHEGVVLDPFMGSGSTGEAAVLAGRSFIGIERDALWFTKAAERLQRLQEDVALVDMLRDG